MVISTASRSKNAAPTNTVCGNTNMDFVRLPVEIRVKIYTELLVLTEPIIFELDLSPTVALNVLKMDEEQLCFFH